MKKIFLSCHFGDSDRELVSSVNSLLESHNLRVVMGDILGGGELTDTIKERISSSDALVALMTTRNDDKNFGGTHPWVVDEYKYARNIGKNAISLIWPGVDALGAYPGNERIEYSEETPLEAFIKLSKTVGLWKSEAGRTIKVQISPETIAASLANPAGGGECLYRYYKEGNPSEWKKGKIVPEGDGTYVYLPGIQDETYLQLQANHQGMLWYSTAIAQSIPIELKTP